MECCHQNDIRSDNRVSNLRWGTRKDNVGECIARGRFTRGEKNGNSTLEDTDIPHIRELLREGVKVVEIAERFNVGEDTISNIKRGVRWNWLKEGIGVYKFRKSPSNSKRRRRL
jgi:hypothetical protein